MRRVTLDARMVSSGGIGTYILQIVAALYLEVELTLLIYKKDLAYFAHYPEVTLILMRSAIYSIKEQIELWWKIKRADLFFAPHFNIPLLPIRATRRITCIHDLYHLAHPIPWIQKLYAHLFYNAASWISDVVITISHFSFLEMERFLFLKRKNRLVIYQALPLFVHKKEIGPRFLEEAYILTVGNLKPHKNIKRLLNAYQLLQPKEKLVIVGRQKGFLSEESFSDIPEGVIFTDTVSEEQLLSLYAHARLFVFPSLYEGFGSPPIEAMAMGNVVVASKCASIPEICKEGAYYVDAFSETSLAEGIKCCLENEELRKKLIEKGQEVAYSYSFKDFKENYINIIHENCSRA